MLKSLRDEPSIAVAAAANALKLSGARATPARGRRNCFGVSGGGAEGALARFDLTAVGAALFAVAVVLAARRARCLVAKSFALGSTISAGEPSRAMRWSLLSTACQYKGAIFQRLSTPSVYG